MATALVTQIAYAVQTLFDPAGTAGRLVDLGKLANYGLLTSFTPAALFTTGVNGAWYDPSDFSTMFQDAAGTTPVTAVGQPVGLMLDKSNGLVLGSEQFPSYDFTNWTSAGGTSSKTQNSFTTTSSGGIIKSIPGGVGKTYQTTISGTTSAVLTVRNGNSLDGAYSISPGTFAVTITSPGCFASNASIYLSITGAGTATITTFSVRELPGNHAFNPSGNSANFPVLSARYNLLTKTEQFDDATWRTTAAFTTITGGFTDQNGTNNAFKLVGANKNIYQSISGLTAGTQVGFTIAIKADSSGTVTISNANGGVTPLTCNVTTNWQYFSLPFASVGSNDGPALFTNGTLSTIYAAFPDLRVSNDALNQPAYQRVNTATDYDTVGFKPYLSFNGTNQWLQTNSINFTYGDKMFVSAGVRKLSDAALAAVAELSATSAANAGSWLLAAPRTPATADYGFRSAGTVVVDALSPASYSSPNTSVVIGIGNISAPSATLRANGSQVAQSTATQGTGNYGNYPLYIGARAGSSLWFNGRLYGMVIAGKQASASEIASTETWLNQKTGAY